MKFADLRLSTPLLKAVDKMGFKAPSPVQVETIPLLLEGHDLVVLAKTGSGKTAAFGLPILDLVDANQPVIQALVVTPTRELAQQIEKEFMKMGQFTKVVTVVLHGGVKVEWHLNVLNKKPQVVVGTPGRLLDLLRRKVLDLSQAHIVVLDEADRMFDMGFRDDVEDILKQTPSERQTLLFSATIPEEVKQLVARHLQHPEYLHLSQDKLTVEEVRQYYLKVSRPGKLSALARYIKENRVRKGIVFCNAKLDVDKIATGLRAKGVRCSPIHGGYRQVRREYILDGFKKGRFQVLVATDLAARGLHIDDVTHVINYSFPTREYETYVHRIGRTARQGKEGIALTLLSSRTEERAFFEAQKKIGSHAEELEGGKPHTHKPEAHGKRKGRHPKRRSRGKRGRSQRGRTRGKPRSRDRR